MSETETGAPGEGVATIAGTDVTTTPNTAPRRFFLFIYFSMKASSFNRVCYGLLVVALDSSKTPGDRDKGAAAGGQYYFFAIWVCISSSSSSSIIGPSIGIVLF